MAKIKDTLITLLLICPSGQTDSKLNGGLNDRRQVNQKANNNTQINRHNKT